ncbi:MAG: hypothetical protein KDD99_32490, partial [Bacteroidetes bacterium]|nr:hypothetical protein [Bacteroidota bacterium]
SRKPLNPDYPFFAMAGLDSLVYYQLIYPPNGVGYTSFVLPDSQTQFAPFIVENGSIYEATAIYLDDQLIYLQNSNEKSNYVFSVDSGYHKLFLQYRDQMVSSDSVYFPAGEKTLISYDLDSPQVLNIALNKKSNEYELKRKKVHFFLLDNHYSYKDIMVTQGEATYWIPGSSRHNYREYLIGPMKQDSMTIAIEDSFEVRTVFEPGYLYSVQPGFVKMKETEIEEKLSLPKSWYSYSGRFREQIYTKEDVLKEWHNEKEKANQRKFAQRFKTKKDKPETGNLMVKTPLDSLVSFSFLKEKNNPDSLSGFFGKPSTFPFLKPGEYELIFLLSDTTWAQVKNLKVKGNGLNYYVDSQVVSLPLTDSLLNEYEEIRE